MEVAVSQDGDMTVLTIKGRLDTATAPQLQEMLIPLVDSAKRVKLDFANLIYISSAGLRVLLLGEKTAKSRDGSMNIVNVADDVREIFEITGFADILKIA